MGRNTVCSVSFTIDSTRSEEFLMAAENRTKVEISSDSGYRLMDGIVSSVIVTYGTLSSEVAVTITSESLLMQEKGEERIFQNPEKTYADILKEYPDVETGKCTHLNDTVEEIVYQHNMDDFSFLLYLAAKCGEGLFITDDGKVSFGMINSTKSMTDEEKAHQKSVLEKIITAEKNGREINIRTMEQLPNGSVLIHEQTPYTICRVHVQEIFNDVYFRYIGYTNPNFSKTSVKPEKLITKAKITDNKDPENLGRVQVEFLEFSDKDTKKTWINYLTPFIGINAGGQVMLPDVDDEVVICISDGVPYAINSLRNEALPENCQDITRKHLAIKDSVITFDENEITIKQGNKSSVIVKPDKIVVENSKGKLSVESSSAVLAGGNSKLSLNNGSTKLVGSTIDLNTQGISS